jgi:hypothetical protein
MRVVLHCDVVAASDEGASTLTSRERRQLRRQSLPRKVEEEPAVEEEVKTVETVFPEETHEQTVPSVSSSEKPVSVVSVEEYNLALLAEALSRGPQDHRLTRHVHPAWFVGWELDDILDTAFEAFKSCRQYKRGVFTVCDWPTLQSQLSDWHSGKLSLEEVRIDHHLFNSFKYLLWPQSHDQTTLVKHFWLSSFGKTRKAVEEHLRNTLPTDICTRNKNLSWTYASLLAFLLDVAFDEAHPCPYVHWDAAVLLRDAFYARQEKKRAVREVRKGCDEESDGEERPRHKNAGQGKSKRKTPRRAAAS